MTNTHLYLLINAPPGLDGLRLWWATAAAEWAIFSIPLAGLAAWWRGPRVARIELLQVLATVLLALALAQAVAHVWPQPRPFALRLGTQYLAHSADPGLPSDHAVVIWAVALAVLRTQWFAVWGLPLLALGLVVGWFRVYLGVHFPLDVAAALPVAGAAVVGFAALRSVLLPVFAWLLDRHDRINRRLQQRFHPVHDAPVDKR